MCSELAKMADDDARRRKLAGLKKGGGVGRKGGFGYLHDRRFAEPFRHGILFQTLCADMPVHPKYISDTIEKIEDLRWKTFFYTRLIIKHNHHDGVVQYQTKKGQKGCHAVLVDLQGEFVPQDDGCPPKPQEKEFFNTVSLDANANNCPRRLSTVTVLALALRHSTICPNKANSHMRTRKPTERLGPGEDVGVNGSQGSMERGFLVIGEHD